MIFLSLRVAADAEGGLKGAAQMRRSLQGFGGGQPPTSQGRYIPTHCLPLPGLPLPGLPLPGLEHQQQLYNNPVI